MIGSRFGDFLKSGQSTSFPLPLLLSLALTNAAAHVDAGAGSEGAPVNVLLRAVLRSRGLAGNPLERSFLATFFALDLNSLQRLARHLEKMGELCSLHARLGLPPDACSMDGLTEAQANQVRSAVLARSGVGTPLHVGAAAFSSSPTSASSFSPSSAFSPLLRPLLFFSVARALLLGHPRKRQQEARRGREEADRPPSHGRVCLRGREARGWEDGGERHLFDVGVVRRSGFPRQPRGESPSPTASSP